VHFLLEKKSKLIWPYMYIERKLKEQSAIIKSLQDQLEESNVENKELRDLLEIPAESESRPITTTVSVISCKSLC
jgi:cell shape-determining protein MreC